MFAVIGPDAGIVRVWNIGNAWHVPAVIAGPDVEDCRTRLQWCAPARRQHAGRLSFSFACPTSELKNGKKRMRRTNSVDTLRAEGWTRIRVTRFKAKSGGMPKSAISDDAHAPSTIRMVAPAHERGQIVRLAQIRYLRCVRRAGYAIRADAFPDAMLVVCPRLTRLPSEAHSIHRPLFFLRQFRRP
jgi:hypothetical protein